MKRAVLGSLLVLGLVMVAVAVGQQRGDLVGGQRATAAPAAASGTELIVVPTPLGEKGQMLTVVDARQRVLSVYHIDATGKIALRSVRNIHWDLQIENYNSDNPSPREMRSLVEQK